MIVRIYTREPKSDHKAQTADDLVVSVGETKISGVISVSFGENGTIHPGGLIEATIRVPVRIGKE